MSLSIFCDGGSRGNPGPAAIGFVVIQEGREIKRASKKIGQTTNNVAEYQAVIAVLSWLLRNQDLLPDPFPINLYLDSQLVARQLTGVYKIKNQKLRKLAITAKNLEKSLNGKIFYHAVPREKNKVADFLVKKALEK